MTIDAMGTQTAIAQTILDGGGDYVLSLGDDWPAARAEVERVFADPQPDLAIQRSEMVDGDHGRIEVRRHDICHDIG